MRIKPEELLAIIHSYQQSYSQLDAAFKAYKLRMEPIMGAYSEARNKENIERFGIHVLESEGREAFKESE